MVGHDIYDFIYPILAIFVSCVNLNTNQWVSTTLRARETKFCNYINQSFTFKKHASWNSSGNVILKVILQIKNYFHIDIKMWNLKKKNKPDKLISKAKFL